MERQVYTGPATGGPADGRTLTSRYQRGLLLVDRPAARVWIYDYAPGLFGAQLGTFTAREPDGRVEDVPGRFRAALEPDFDVISAAVLEEASP
jgi:hypothetical protein